MYFYCFHKHTYIKYTLFKTRKKFIKNSADVSLWKKITGFVDLFGNLRMDV